MPAQVTVLAEFDAQTSAELSSHAHDPLRSGFSDLPAGIKGGVAKLIKCRFERIGPDTSRKHPDGTTLAGEAQFVLVGTVMEPKTIVDVKTGQVIRVAGQQFRPIPRPVCDMKTRDGVRKKGEQALSVMEDMKTAANNERLFPQKVTAAVMEQLAKAMEDRSNGTPDQPAKPIYFQFDTTASDDGSMVFQNVRKWSHDYPPDAYVPPSPTAAVQDMHQAPPTQTFSPAPQQTTAQVLPTAPTIVVQAPIVQMPVSQPEVDIAKLVALASGDDRLKEVRDAQMHLMNAWKASGRSEQSFKDANTYNDAGLVLMGGWAVPPNIVAGQPWAAVSQQSQPATAAPEQHLNGAPKKDDVWKVKLTYTDPITDEVRTALVDAVVTSANPDGTFDLVDLKTRAKPFKSIKRDDLVVV